MHQCLKVRCIRVLLLLLVILTGSNDRLMANSLNTLSLKEWLPSRDLKGAVRIWLNKQGKLLDTDYRSKSLDSYTIDIARVVDSLETHITPYERYSFWGNNFSYKTVHYKQLVLKLLIEGFKQLDVSTDSVALIRKRYKKLTYNCIERFRQLYSKNAYKEDRGKLLTRFEIESMLETIPLKKILLQSLSRVLVSVEGDSVVLPYNTFLEHYDDWGHFSTMLFASRQYDYNTGTELVRKSNYNRIIDLSKLDTTTRVGFECQMYNHYITNLITQDIFQTLINRLKLKAKEGIISFHEAIYEMDIMLNSKYRKKYRSLEFYYANKLYRRHDYIFPTGVSVWLYLNSQPLKND